MLYDYWLMFPNCYAKINIISYQKFRYKRAKTHYGKWYSGNHSIDILIMLAMAVTRQWHYHGRWIETKFNFDLA